jgi:hypothetical protein
MTLERLLAAVESQRQRQERLERLRQKAGAIYDPILKRWIRRDGKSAK